jgi:hypothetical protein
MKKFLKGLFAIMIIATTSCQNDESFDMGINPGTIVEVQFQPVIPASVTSLSSGNGGIDNVDDAGYDLRYLLEVWSADGSTFVYRDTVIATGYTAPVNFSVQLPAAVYKFVFWADFVTKGTVTDLTYKTDNSGGLKDIEWTAAAYVLSSDLRDAYYAVREVDLTNGGTVNGNVTLKRPFGKLRVLATDLYDENVVPAKAVIKYTHAGMPSFRKSFNALAGETNAATISAGGNLESVPELETSVTVSETPYTNVYLLAFDYFLIPADLTAVSFDIELFDGANASLGAAKSISSVPVGVNKLTTVIGAFLPPLVQGEAHFSVIVDDDFDNEDDYTTTVASVSLNKNELWLLTNGEETLIANVLPANAANKNVAWSSNNASVATVDNTGKVTAVAIGAATITAASTANGAKIATCAVTVLATSGAVLQNGWFINGWDNWIATPSDVFKRVTDVYLPTGAPTGAYYITSNIEVTQSFEGKLTQHLTNVPDGTYTLSCDLGGFRGSSPDTDGVYLVASDKDDNEIAKLKCTLPEGGWTSAKDITNSITVNVTGGECTVGLYVKAVGGTTSTMTFKVLNFKFE